MNTGHSSPSCGRCAPCRILNKVKIFFFCLLLKYLYCWIVNNRKTKSQQKARKENLLLTMAHFLASICPLCGGIRMCLISLFALSIKSFRLSTLTSAQPPCWLLSLELISDSWRILSGYMIRLRIFHNWIWVNILIMYCIVYTVYLGKYIGNWICIFYIWVNNNNSIFLPGSNLASVNA